MAELSHRDGYYQHELVRTGDGWRGRRPREDNVWFINSRPIVRRLVIWTKYLLY